MKNDVLLVDVEVHDPKLLKHIARGWIGGMSMGSRGQLMFVANYPWWYRALFHVKRWFRKIWNSLRGRHSEDGFWRDPETGNLIFGENFLSPRARVVSAYRVNQPTLDLMEWEKRHKQ